VRAWKSVWCSAGLKCVSGHAQWELPLP
jgi:hypothetical protein